MNTTPSFGLHNFAQKHRWTAVHMPRTRQVLARLPASLDGVRLACNMNLDIKMIPFVEGLLARGTAVYLTTCHPTTCA